MSKSVLAALLLLAAPALALAQSTPNNSRVQPIPNQTNLQGQANQNMQPLNAQGSTSGTSLGQADRIPTPTLGNGMSRIPDQRAPR